MAVFKFITGSYQKGSDHPVTHKTLYSVKRLINYMLRPDKTLVTLMGGIHCNPDTAYDEFILTKALHNKLPEKTLSEHNEVIHAMLSFEGQEASPLLAKQIAEELLTDKKFKGFQILYAVHIDTDDVHVHFAINSVNYETGARWHHSTPEAEYLIKLANDISKGYGLTEVKLKKHSPEIERHMPRHRNVTQGEYHAKLNGRSWKAETLHAGLAVKKIASSKDEFIVIMKSVGYTVRWEDNRKDITFTNRDGKKVNSDKLGFPSRNYTPLTKEALERQFALNRQVKENVNRTVTIKKDQLQHQILKLAKELANDKDNRYPFQNSAALRSTDQGGQAIKDKLKELQKGKGLDWERD